MPKNSERPWEDDAWFNGLSDAEKLIACRYYVIRPTIAMPTNWLAWLLHKAERVVTSAGVKA